MDVSVGNKRHVFVFRTKQGAMTVGTDNLSELSNQSWFTNFLGEQRASRPRDTEVYGREELKEDVRRMVNSMMNEVASEMLQNQKYQQDDLPPPLPEDDFRTVAEQAAQEMERQQRVMDQGRPDIRQDMPGVGRQNFMDITPDKMTEKLWMSLTPEQQQQYGQKYMS